MTSVTKIVSAIVLGNIALAVLSMLPGFMVEMSRLMGLTDRQLGVLASADLVGLAVGALLWKPILHKYSLRKICLVTGIALCILNIVSLNIVSSHVSAYAPLLASRFSTGLCAGGLHAIAFLVLGSIGDPDRNFGLFILVWTIFAGLLLILLPYATEFGGIKFVYTALAVGGIIGGSLGFLLPVSVAGKDCSTEGRAVLPILKKCFPQLIGVFGIFAAAGAFWAYMSRIGEEAGFGVHSVSLAAASTQVVGFFGAALAIGIGRRYGSIRPLSLSLAIILAMCSLLTGPISFSVYVVGICGFIFAWNFSAPLNLALLARADKTGSAVIYGSCVSNVGLAAGPVAAAALLSPGNLAPPVMYVTAAFATVSVVALFAASR